MQEFRPGQRVRLLTPIATKTNHDFTGGETGTVSDLFGGKAQVAFDADPDSPLIVDSSALEPVPDSNAKTFEELVLRYIGKDIAYCEKYSVYGLSFARAAWDAGVASTERRKYRFAAMTDREGKELSYPGYRRMPLIKGEDITFPAMTEDHVEAHVGFSYDETGPIWPAEGLVSTMNKGDSISVSRPVMRDFPDEWRK